MQDGSATEDFGRFQADGDLPALERALLAASPALLQQAWALTRHHADAADLVQETLIAAIRQRDQFRGDANFESWLRGILRNKERKRRARPQLRTTRLAANPDGRSVEPAELAQATETRQLLTAALHKLPPRYREVLDLYLAGETNAHEIAHRLHRSPSTVRTQLERGLAKMRDVVPKSLAPLLIAILAVRSAARSPIPVLVPRGRWPRWAILAVGALLALMVVLAWPWGSAPSSTSERDVQRLVHTPVQEADAGRGRALASVPAPKTAASAPATVEVALRWADGDRPAAGVAVILEAPAHPGTRPLIEHFATWHYATTNEFGVVRFSHVPPGPAQVRLDDVAVRQRLDVAAADTTRVVEAIRATFQIRGTVRDTAGNPIAGAEVWVSGSGRIMTPGYVACLTDGKGRYQAPVFFERGGFELWAEASQIGASNCYRPASGSRAIEQALVVRSANRRVEGVLVGPDGAGVRGTLALYPSRRADCAPPTRYTLAGESGRFAFVQLEPTRYRLAATARNLAGRAVELDLLQNDSRGLTVRLTHGVMISGRVHGFGADDLGRLRVGGRSAAPMRGAPEQFLLLPTTAVASDASFRVGPFPPGPTIVGLQDLARPHGPVDAQRLEIPLTGVLRCDFFAAAGAHWRIRVRMPSGAPGTGLWVALAHRTENPSAGEYTAVVATNAAGWAVFGALPNQPLDVYVLRDPKTPLPLVFAAGAVPGAELVLELPTHAGLSRVSGALARPAEQVDREISLRLRHLASTAARTIALPARQREFVFGRVPPGVYALEGLGPGKPRAAAPIVRVVVEAETPCRLGELRAPEWAAVVVHAPGISPGSTLPFSVRHPNGGLLVAAELTAGGGREFQLPVGPLRFEFLDAAGRLRSRSVTVPSLERLEVQLDVGRGHPVRLRFPFGETEGRDALTGDALVTIRAADASSTRVFDAVYFGDSRYEIRTDLAPGVFEISFVAKWNQPQVRTVRVLGQPELQEFRLPLVRR